MPKYMIHKLYKLALLTIVLSCTICCSNNKTKKELAADQFSYNNYIEKSAKTYLAQIDTLHEPITIPVNIDDNVTELYCSEIFDSLYIVKLESTEESLIGQIDKISFYNDTIYILDRRNLKCLKRFSLTGKYIDQIGSLGIGPGEYIDIFDFSVTSRGIEVYDPGTKRITLYNSDGEFKSITEVPFFANSFLRTDSNTLVFNTSGADNYHIPSILNHGIVITDNDCNIRRHAISRPLEKTPLITTCQALRCSQSNECILTETFTDTLYIINNDSKIRPQYTFAFNKNVRNTSEMYNKPISEIIKDMNNPLLATILNSTQTSNHVILDFLYNNKIYHTFYNINRNNGVTVLDFKADSVNFIYPISNIFIAKYKDNTLVSTIDASILYSKYNAIKDHINELDTIAFLSNYNKTNKSGTTAQRELCSVHLEDNPILIFYRLKL